ncbi:MAG: HNH endonuclease [Candidatus Krumholzibacteria bacterium]|nr:HNH endonuclease [Candidatus Krumholzibacteria bacterium]
MSLRSFSDKKLLSRTHRLVRCERMCMVRVLSHLNEIEERKLHFELGYRSMLHFCVEALGYARSSAGRRITAARCMKRFPEVRAMLDAGEVNVVTIACVAGILTPDNSKEVLKQIRGRTQEEVEAIVACYRPREAVRDRVREVLVPRLVVVAAVPTISAQTVGASCVPAAAAQTVGASCVSAAVVPEAMQAPAGEQSHCETECKDSPGESTDNPPQTEFERRAVLEFSVSKAFMGKLGRFRSLMWHRLPANATLEQVFELLLDRTLQREDPVARRERRQKREDRRQTNSSPARRQSHCETECKDSPSREPRNPRHIPARVRDEVFVRDKGRCAFVGSTGRKCGSTSGLQVDHVIPVARGGGATPSNLRLLCAWHNRLEAERLLGKCIPGGRVLAATAWASPGRAQSQRE